MSGTTPNLGLPFAEPSDAIADYPALDETRAGLLDVAGLVCIDDQIAGATVPNFDFASIPQNFAALKALVYARSDQAAALNLGWRANGDATANYNAEIFNAIGGAPSSLAQVGLTLGMAASLTTSSAGANAFTTAEITFYNYAATTVKRHGLSQFFRMDGGGVVGLYSAEWNGAAAINRLTFLGSVGNLVAGSRVTLYGLGLVGG